MTDSFGNHFAVYLYSVDSLPPLPIPAGRRTWVDIRQGFANCSFLWNRSDSSDTGTAVVGIANTADQVRYSEWELLRPQAHLAFSLYGSGRTE